MISYRERTAEPATLLLAGQGDDLRSGDVPQQVFGAVMPYVAFGVLMLLVVLAFPPVATWLPKVLFAK